MRLLVLALVGSINLLSAQQLNGFATKWDDSFTEWTIIADDESQIGDMSMRWRIRNDWSEWDYRLGEISGSIKVKWKDDPNLWELRGGNEVVTIRAVFRDDWRQWEIRSVDYTFDMQSRYGNMFEEWEVTSTDHGEFQIYTAFERDLRDWVVEDGLDPAVSIHTKIAMAFIPILYSTPKQ